MNVAGPLLDGQGQDVVCQPNDGSILGCGRKFHRVDFFFLVGLDLHAGENLVLKILETL